MVIDHYLLKLLWVGSSKNPLLQQPIGTYSPVVC